MTFKFKRVLSAVLVSTALLSTNSAMAYQTVSGVITGSHMDHATNRCTVTLDRGHHVTNRTNQCHARKFSWGCLRDDYRFAAAEISQKNRTPIKIRYSEYYCDAPSGNMLLLTVW